MNGGSSTNSSIEKKLHNEYSDIIDFMSIRGSQEPTFVDADTIKLENVELPKLPSELNGVFDITDWFRVYVNGVFIPSAKYSYTGSYQIMKLYLIFQRVHYQLVGFILMI